MLCQLPIQVHGYKCLGVDHTKIAKQYKILYSLEAIHYIVWKGTEEISLYVCPPNEFKVL